MTLRLLALRPTPETQKGLTVETANPFTRIIISLVAGEGFDLRPRGLTAGRSQSDLFLLAIGARLRQFLSDHPK